MIKRIHMIKRIVLVFVLGLGFGDCFSQAPPWEWARDAGGLGNDISYSVSANNSGSVFITGRFNDMCHFGNDSVISFGGPDIFVARYDTYGNLIWVRHGGSTDVNNIYGDEGEGIGTDAFGNCYITGHYYSQASFGTLTLNASVPKTEIFIVKYDQNGNVIWAQQPTGGIMSNSSRSIAVDSIGNSYITGYIGGGTNIFGSYSLSKTGAYIVKYDSSGTVVYATKLGNNGAIDAFGISIDHLGNAFITGSLYGTDTINGQVFTSSSFADVIIIKIDPLGNFLWLRKSSSSSQVLAYGQAIAADTYGNVISTGYFSDSITFGNTTLFANSPFYSFFVAKFNPSGNFIWAKQFIDPSPQGYSSPQGFAIKTDYSSNVYVTGVYRDSIIIGGCVLGDFGTAAFIVKYDSSGNCVWSTGSEGGNVGAFGYGISLNNSNECYITGFDKGPPIFGNSNLQFHGGEDIFLAKLNTLTGIFDLQPPASNFQLFPNPATSTIRLTFNTKHNGAVRCEIWNVMGERVYETPLPAHGASWPKCPPDICPPRGEESYATFDVSFLAKGIYVVRVGDGVSWENRKLVME